MEEPLTIERDGDRWTLSFGASRIVTHRPQPGLVILWRGELAPGDDLAPAVAEILAFVAHGARHVITWNLPDRAPVNAALLAAGCTVHREKLFVRRELSGELPAAAEFAWRTLAEVGKDGLLPILWAASEDDPFEEDERDAEREWRELVEHTGDDLDPALWRVALVQGAPVGVVLPTIWEGPRQEGTLSYVGVVPEHRGRGLGRALHAAGLRLLAGAGALRYAGSTDVRNVPMARVFAANGCSVQSIQSYLRPPDAP